MRPTQMGLGDGDEGITQLTPPSTSRHSDLVRGSSAVRSASILTRKRRGNVPAQTWRRTLGHEAKARGIPSQSTGWWLIRSKVLPRRAQPSFPPYFVADSSARPIPEEHLPMNVRQFPHACDDQRAGCPSSS